MNDELTLGQLVRRWWWALLAAGVIGAVAGYAVANVLPKSYQSTATMLVGPVSTGSSADLTASSSLTSTFESLATTEPVLTAAISSTHTALTPSQLEAAVTTTSNSISRLVTVTVSNQDPKLAADLANAVAARIATVAHSSSGAVAGRVTIVGPAVPATSASSPKKSLFVVLGGFAGVLAAALLLLGRAGSSRAPADERSLEELAYRNLGVVDTSPARASAEAFALATQSTASSARDYRMLAARLSLADPLPRSILVVDSTDGSAAAVVAANLAALLSQLAVGSVLLADVSTESAGVTKFLGLQGQEGYGELVEVPDLGTLNGRLTDLLVDRWDRTFVLPQGIAGAERTVSVDRAREFVSRLQGEADLIVLSGPPLSRSANGLSWARAADSTLFVVDGNRVSQDELKQAVDELSQVNPRFLGVVMGRRRLALPGLKRGARA